MDPANLGSKPQKQAFEILHRRWVVERTFGWLGRNRRLSKDYEGLPVNEEALIYLAMVNLMLGRFSRELTVRPLLLVAGQEQCMTQAFFGS